MQKTQQTIDGRITIHGHTGYDDILDDDEPYAVIDQDNTGVVFLITTVFQTVDGPIREHGQLFSTADDAITHMDELVEEYQDLIVYREVRNEVYWFDDWIAKVEYKPPMSRTNGSTNSVHVRIQRVNGEWFHPNDHKYQYNRLTNLASGDQ